MTTPGPKPPPTLELKLDSAKGNQIPNEQVNEVSQFVAGQKPDFASRYLVIEVRGVPTGRYNCHGLTFAARRTGIHEIGVLTQILDEDSYIEVKPDHVIEGDVIIYFDPDTGDPEHSGIVVSKPSPNTFGVPIVCSKWGWAEEYIHVASQCPYSFGAVRYYRVQA